MRVRSPSGRSLLRTRARLLEVGCGTRRAERADRGGARRRGDRASTCRSAWSSSRAGAASTRRSESAGASLRRRVVRHRRGRLDAVPRARSRSGRSAEIARVLAPGGQLVAVTNSELHLEEARAHAGVTMVGRLPFNRDNGEEILARHFATVERIDVDGWVTFPDAEAIRRYVRSMITAGRTNADRVPTTSGRCARARGSPSSSPSAMSGTVRGRTRRSVRTGPMIRPADLIERKRNGEEHAPEDVAELDPRLRPRRGARLPDGGVVHGRLLQGPERRRDVCADRRDDPLRRHARLRRRARAQGRRQALDGRRRRQDVDLRSGRSSPPAACRSGR